MTCGVCLDWPRILPELEGGFVVVLGSSAILLANS